VESTLVEDSMNTGVIKITTAIYNIHDRDCLRLALSSWYTRHFALSGTSNQRNFYEGMIRVALLDNKVVGFTCRWECRRKPYTTANYLVVDEEHRRRGIGVLLTEDLKWISRWGVIRSEVHPENAPQIALRLRTGFQIIGTTKHGNHLMEWRSDEVGRLFV
jgi:GNAT superfamily N-acetyltransferase